MTGSQKANVALEAMKDHKTVNKIAQEYGVHPTRVGLWKKALLENADQLFDLKRSTKPAAILIMRIPIKSNR